MRQFLRPPGVPVLFTLSVCCLLTASGCSGNATAPMAPPALISVGISIFGPTGGSSEQFTATAHFSDRGGQDVTKLSTWETSDPGIAVISSSGLLTVLSPGRVTVTATYHGQSGSLTLRLPVDLQNFD